VKDALNGPLVPRRKPLLSPGYAWRSKVDIRGG
jgi:hypothetical protein